MRIIEASNYYDMSCKAASLIASQIVIKPNSVIGLATGSTPEGLYRQLISKYTKGELDFSKVHAVHLDEYLGLDKTSDQSYQYYIYNKLFNHINIAEDNCHTINGMAEDSEKESERYDKLIEDLGFIDIQLLGIGPNGHIGFNEPSDHFAKGTHIEKLSKSTIDANSRFFDNYDDVPRFAYTVGVKNIMQADKILLVANGQNKAKVLKEVISGRITPQIPATILQLHNNVTIVADREALSLL